VAKDDDSPVVGDDVPFAEPVLSPAPQTGQASGEKRPELPRSRRPRKFAPSRRRPWWKWVLIALLLLLSLAITVLYVAALAADLSRRHWAEALDASRDAVPAVVGWGALLIVFFSGGTVAAERMLSVDNYAIGQKQKQVATDQDSVQRAEQRVAQLTTRLAQLRVAQEAADSTADAGRARRIADTTARLDQASQWLVSAQAALAASQRALAAAEHQLGSDFPLPRAGDS